MPGRSASDRSPAGARATAGSADRLSLTVSALLIGGLLLASLALYQSAQTDKPKAPKRPSEPIVKKSSDRQSNATAMVIRLPPPPAPAARLSGVAVRKSAIAPQRSPLKPVRRAVDKPRVVEPLGRTVAVKPAPPPPVQPRPEAKPVVREPVVTKPAVKAPEKTETAATGPVVNGTQNRKAGGALLRLLEHGQGPTIEIAWPQRPAVRRALYHQLTHCYGVKAAVLAEGTALYEAAGAPGQAWSIDRDRFSGFIRSPQGEAIAEEEGVFAGIADRHDLDDWRPVRVFPRQVDAALLGGLGAVLGPQYKSASQIRAAYRWDRTRLILADFTVDGQPITGVVTLPLPRGPARGPGCD